MPRNDNTESARVIRRMVKRIADRFRPERIILFGSHARGGAGRDSDVDLLVVMPVSGSVRETRIEIGAALGDFGVPVDIVVATPEQFARRSNIPGTIERPAFLEGVVLHERGRRTAPNHTRLDRKGGQRS
jgi:predicted nucleotidyltransferase